MLLQQELREVSVYNSIISAVAAGTTRLNEIVGKTGEEKTKLTKYISTLINLNILERAYPFGEKPEASRKGIYQIADNCYRFWYHFVFGNQNEIDSGTGGHIADRYVFGEALSNFIEKPAFEHICLSYLMRLNAALMLPFLA